MKHQSYANLQEVSDEGRGPSPLDKALDYKIKITEHSTRHHRNERRKKIVLPRFWVLQYNWALSPTLVLATLNFTKTFIGGCDTSGHGIGAILMQEVVPLSIEIIHLKGKNLLKPIYEKEMLAILHAIMNWCLYLIGRHFKVKMDHDSLKYFLEKKLSSEEKQKMITKIIGYNFEIIYRKGKQTMVEYELSRK